MIFPLYCLVFLFKITRLEIEHSLQDKVTENMAGSIGVCSELSSLKVTIQEGGDCHVLEMDGHHIRIERSSDIIISFFVGLSTNVLNKVRFLIMLFSFSFSFCIIILLYFIT